MLFEAPHLLVVSSILICVACGVCHQLDSGISTCVSIRFKEPSLAFSCGRILEENVRSVETSQERVRGVLGNSAEGHRGRERNEFREASSFGWDLTEFLVDVGEQE